MLVRPSSLPRIALYLRAHVLAILDEAQSDPAVRAALLDHTGRANGFKYTRERGDVWESFIIARAEHPGPTIDSDCEDLTAYHVVATILRTGTFVGCNWLVEGQPIVLRITRSGPNDAHAYYRVGSTIFDPAVWHGMSYPGDTLYASESVEIQI